jgi:tetratricopeptide (TPR) repeat protein
MAVTFFHMNRACHLLPLLAIIFICQQRLDAQEDLTELYYSGYYTSVIHQASGLIEAGDTTFSTYYLKALSEIQTGQNIDAIMTLRAAGQIHPGDIRIQRMIAMQYYEAGDYPQAWNRYTSLVKEDSTDVSSWLKIADIASFRQQYAEAIKALNQILIIDSLNLSSLMMMGDILDRHNNTGAVLYYQRAYRLYPNNQKAAFALANKYIQMKNAWDAVPICENMLSQDTGSIKFSKLLGYAHYKAGQPADAIRWFQYANDLGDSTAFTYKFKGISLYLMADFGPAIGALENAVNKDSLDAEVHFFLGASLATIAAMKEAMQHLNKSLELMRPDPSVVSRIYSEQGNIKRLEMEYQEAYSLYEKAWETDSTNVLSLYFMASIMDNSMHQRKEALTDYQRYIDALDRLPETGETSQGVSIRAIVEDRIITLKEELFFRDEQ